MAISKGRGGLCVVFWVQIQSILGTNRTGPIPRKNMNNPIFMKHAQCGVMNEKYIFRYLFFELWSICSQFSSVFTDQKCQQKKVVWKDAHEFLFIEFFICVIFSLWDMVDLALSQIPKMSTKRSCSCGACRSVVGTEPNQPYFDDCVFDSLWTWLRNANQWYPITSWLVAFKSKGYAYQA